jgi:hypothetical protein
VRFNVLPEPFDDLVARERGRRVEHGLEGRGEVVGAGEDAWGFGGVGGS